MTEVPPPSSFLSLTEIEAPAESRWKRLLDAAECRTQTDLAAFMGVRQSSIAAAKRRASLPSDWQLTLLSKKGINPAWLVTGLGPHYLQPSYSPPSKRSQPMTEDLAYWEAQLQGCPSEALLAEFTRRVLKVMA